MIRLQLRTTWANKRRFAGTVLAVFLGVAFLAGTLTLGETLESNFDQLFTEAGAGTDTVVRRDTKIDAEVPTDRGLIDESLVNSVREVDGVAVAEPSVQGFGRLVGADGEGIGGNGPPTFAGSWIDDPALNPFEIAEGRAPRAPDEVVVNRGAADSGGLELGDTTTLQTPEPLTVRIVGISTFGGENGLGASTFTALTLDSAQEHITKAPGQVTSIVVRAEPGVSETVLTQQVAAVLPDGVEAISGAQLTAERTADLNADFLDLLQIILVAFAAIALLVATFSIFNTFSIVVAQRTRESALLRAVGATRRQLLAAVVTESLVVGVVASVAGVAGGLGFATLLQTLLGAVGPNLPAGGLVLTTTTVLVSVGVGVLVTFVAGIAPAVRASRVAPLAAIRDVSVERIGATRARMAAGLALVVLGVGAVAIAALALESSVLTVTALGAALTVAGVVVSGPVIARGASRVIGAPLPRLRGVAGTLARQNAMRNPKRTASTSAALMVGVAVVAVFTVFAASLKASVDGAVSSSLRGDIVIASGGFGDGELSPQLARVIDDLPEVDDAVGLGVGGVLLDGDAQRITVADVAALPSVLDLDVERGSVRDLGSRELAVSSATADDRGWMLGSRVPITFADGETVDFRVGAITGVDELAEPYVVSRAAWAPHAVQDVDATVLVRLADGVTLTDGTAAIERVAAPFGAPEVQTRDEYIGSVAERIDTMLALVYVMLALAVLIALMGIANTLSLSMHERTRELGLLRAVGETRRQLRAMVRWESVIIAVFGTVGGLALGVFLGWGFFEAAASESLGTFSVPATQLVVVLVAGAAAGVLAAVRPARRAARLDVLTAIASE
jgi:putative ABC transport system permease protein